MRMTAIVMVLAALSACTSPQDVCGSDRQCIAEVQAYNAYRAQMAAQAIASAYQQSAATEAYVNGNTRNTVYQAGRVTTYDGYGSPVWRGY